MDKDTWPGTAVADMPESEVEELFDLLEEPATGEHGGQSARIAAFLGFWRTVSGANLRVGIRQDDTFIESKSPGTDVVKAGDTVNLTLRQVYMPDLPHDRCVVQITWRAAHSFDDKGDVEVAHITSCDAGKAGTAAAVGLPIFHDFKVQKAINLSIGIYAMADRGSQPIIEILQSPAVSSGLKLAGKFNPAFGMTVPYIEAAVTGLTKVSRRNFKLANWQVGLQLTGAMVPLVFGEYILLDGVIRIGRETQILAWSDLKWDKDRECPIYRDGAFRNPYLMLSVDRSV
jgi:hypothetical protein